ncbi:MAG: hypothetical protein ACK5DY_10585, partial [Bacteroidota bacterium]
MIKFYQLLILFTITTITCYSQTLVTPSTDANTLAQQLVGNGVIVTNATTNCQTNGTQTASGI